MKITQKDIDVSVDSGNIGPIKFGFLSIFLIMRVAYRRYADAICQDRCNLSLPSMIAFLSVISPKLPDYNLVLERYFNSKLR